ncbi:MAG: hypothetical protein ABIN24_03955 [Dyadobacter sp.]
MRRAFFPLFFLLSGIISCQEDKPKIDCGCDSATIKLIDNVKASYTGSNGLLLKLRSADDVAYEEYYELCSTPDSLSITPNVKIPNYIVSGKVKGHCFTGPTLVIQASLFEITEIKKI